MILRTTPRLAKLGPRVRLGVLVLFALLVAHDAIYMAQFGTGAAYDQTRAAAGSHGYWVPTSIAILVGAAAVFLAGLGMLARLQRQAPAQPLAAPGAPAYAVEVARTWRRLFPTVAVLFGIQENLEQLLAHGQLVGLDPLFGAGADLALPILAVTTFGLAAVGALLRWRIAVLEARIAGVRARRFPRFSAAPQPLGWSTIAAAVIHRWSLVRRDAGRAPPLFLLIGRAAG